MGAEYDFSQGKKDPYGNLRRSDIEELEDLADLKEIADYEERERRGETEYYSAKEVWHMLGLDAENHEK